MKSLFKFVLRVFLWGLVAILIYSISIPFLWGPIYDFPESRPFEGQFFYNPYEGIDSTFWFKGNYHAHANPYGRLTDGRNNSAERLFERYDSLNYQSFSISDYSHIDTFNASALSYIPNYEHGYSPVKYHQLVLGARKVSYFDYPLFQFVSNKQFIINSLKENCELLAIAHPSFLGAYSQRDAEQLCNYDLVEVMNQRQYSFEFWDAALSSGNAVWILANDDVHDLNFPADYGMQATLVNAPSNSKNDVLSAMKSGKTIGYAPVNSSELGHALKVNHKDAFPRLISFNVDKSGKIEGRFSKPIKEFHVYGNHGEEVGYQYTEHQNNFCISAQFQPQDSYLRFKVNFEDADLCYLNPVIRFDGQSLPVKVATVSIFKTIVFRGMAWATSLVIGVYLLTRCRKRKRKGSKNQKI